MFWVIVVAMAVVVGGAALVALGGGGSLPEAVHDRIAARLPQERPLSRQDVDEIRLPMAVRGYRMDEVDDVLDRLGAELAYRDTRIAELEAAVAGLDAGREGAEQPGSEPLPGLEDFAAAKGATALSAPAADGTHPVAAANGAVETAVDTPERAERA
ncbi:DivIVA domain-containing protein [Kitasatospora kifunensis]|uniref:DivIVA domain-containing protein n=1 Tax=Kitasatospora kifunensis TaxID=58351 RepID=A0A7W7R1V2_KITKI|nr:DivIVA domain-containing protein [Kitasatospora kifunensis]MBB4923720.1 DivIVA domain-containing protein [Kitasatospora kifunensis]